MEFKHVENPQIQFASPESIAEFQNARLREEIAYLYARSPYYGGLMRNLGIAPGDIRTVEDLAKLPTTAKEDLQRRSGEFVCVPEHEIRDYVTTSGTLGSPVVFALSDSDLERLAYNEWLSFGTAGCVAGQRLQLMTTLDRRFMAGLAYYMGARRLGMASVRVGNGIPALQWDTIARIHPEVCMVVPSFLVPLVEYAQHQGIDYAHSSLRKAICIGEGIRTPDLSLSRLGERIQTLWPTLELYSTYASTEMQSSFTECECQCGGHAQPDLIICEFLDEQGNPVPEGEPGELTITTLGVRAMPLLRFRTGDVCYHFRQPCPCGRNTLRVSPLLGRKGQMIKYKGTTMYPPALYDILDAVPGVNDYLVEVFENSLGTDEISIRVVTDSSSEAFAKELKDLFRAKVRVAPRIVFSPQHEVLALKNPTGSRKVVKFIDHRVR